MGSEKRGRDSAFGNLGEVESSTGPHFFEIQSNIQREGLLFIPSIHDSPTPLSTHHEISVVVKVRNSSLDHFRMFPIPFLRESTFSQASN